MTGMVILNYNDADTVIKLYDMVVNYTSIHYIVIVDNCSSDNSYQRLKEHCCCDVLLSDKNGGYAYGNNIGVRYLLEVYSCDYIVISNPDVIFDNNYVASIVRVMKMYPSIAIMSGVMLDSNKKEVHSAYGIIPGYLTALLECFYPIRYYQMKFARHRIDYGKKIMPVEVIWGSLFVISAEAYNKIQSFDENTFLYHEENIIGKQIKNLGMREALLTTVSYIHNHGVSISKSSGRLERHIMGLKSQLYFQCRYNNITGMKRNLLRLLMRYSVIELKIINFFFRLMRR